MGPLGGIVKNLVSTLSSASLAVAAVAFAGVAVHREFFPSSVRRARPKFEASWAALVPVGHLIGPPSATVKLLVFSDLECPYCREFHQAARLLMRQYPNDVAMVFLHFPLESHRYSWAAARAAECAGRQEKLMEFLDASFESQQVFGYIPWDSLAVRAGVTRLHDFQTCIGQRSVKDAIDAGLKAGRNLNVRATPTVLVNGWRFDGAPPSGELAGLVNKLILEKTGAR